MTKYGQSFSPSGECRLQTQQAFDDEVSSISASLVSVGWGTAKFLICIPLVDGFGDDVIGSLLDSLELFFIFFLIGVDFSSLYCTILLWYESSVIAKPPALGLEIALIGQRLSEFWF